jgi:hypothetical protein
VIWLLLLAPEGWEYSSWSASCATLRVPLPAIKIKRKEKNITHTGCFVSDDLKDKSSLLYRARDGLRGERVGKESQVMNIAYYSKFSPGQQKAG